MEKENEEKLVVDLLSAVDALVEWGEATRIKKYSIMAKRMAIVSRSSKSVEDFVENLLRQIAGDSLLVSREKATKLSEALKNAKKNEKQVLEYIRNYPYLSTVLYAAFVESLQHAKQKEAEKK